MTNASVDLEYLEGRCGSQGGFPRTVSDKGLTTDQNYSLQSVHGKIYMAAHLSLRVMP